MYATILHVPNLHVFYRKGLVRISVQVHIERYYIHSNGISYCTPNAVLTIITEHIEMAADIERPWITVVRTRTCCNNQQ